MKGMPGAQSETVPTNGDPSPVVSSTAHFTVDQQEYWCDTTVSACTGPFSYCNTTKEMFILRNHSVFLQDYSGFTSQILTWAVNDNTAILGLTGLMRHLSMDGR